MTTVGPSPNGPSRDDASATSRGRRPSTRRGLLLLLLFALAMAVLTPEARPLLDPDELFLRLQTEGPFAPLLYVATFIIAVNLFVPPTVLVLAGGALFGAWQGFLLGMLGMNLGGAIGFVAARFLLPWKQGRFSGVRMQELTRRLECHGVQVVMYLRLAYTPFWLLTFAAALSPIRFPAFLTGTFLGVLPATIMTAFVGQRLHLLLVHPDPALLADPATLAAGGVFLLLALGPLLTRRIRRRRDC